MNTFSRNAILFTFAASLICIPAVASELLAVGDTVSAFEALDQHEKPFTLGDDVAWLLVSFDMGTGKAANRYFEDKGANYLDEKGAVFVANIYGMPGIGRMFALPKMRKYPHRIILADEEGLLDPYPNKDGMVTVFKLAPGRTIESISFWNPKQDDVPLE